MGPPTSRFCFSLNLPSHAFGSHLNHLSDRPAASLPRSRPAQKHLHSPTKKRKSQKNNPTSPEEGIFGGEHVRRDCNRELAGRRSHFFGRTRKMLFLVRVLVMLLAALGAATSGAAAESCGLARKLSNELVSDLDRVTQEVTPKHSGRNGAAPAPAPAPAPARQYNQSRTSYTNVDGKYVSGDCDGYSRKQRKDDGWGGIR